MSNPKSPLQRQLEEQKFLSAVDYVKQTSVGISKLNSNILVHLNHLLTGKSEEPWRFEAAEVLIPTGVKRSFNMLSNPIQKSREIISVALDIAANQDVKESAIYLYLELVTHHLFLNANRRTAALACLWVLEAHSYEIDALDLIRLPLGDIGTKESRLEIETQIKKMIASITSS